jgi:hypothetical protein
MLRCTTVVIALGLLACASSALAADRETSTPQEFQEWGDLVVGRWVGDIKYVADWPGQEQGRGKTVVGYCDYHWTLDKKAIEATTIDGTASSRELHYWDAPTKNIKLFIVSSNGYTLEGVVWKKSKNVFAWRITGGGVVDGRAHGGTGETSFTDNGRTMTITGETTLGGKKNDPLKDVYKKLSP